MVEQTVELSVISYAPASMQIMAKKRISRRFPGDHTCRFGRQFTLQWRRNERDGVSNHRRLHCLLNDLDLLGQIWHRSQIFWLHHYTVHKPDCFMVAILCTYVYVYLDCLRSRLFHSLNTLQVYWSRQPRVFWRVTTVLHENLPVTSGCLSQWTSNAERADFMVSSLKIWRQFKHDLHAYDIKAIWPVTKESADVAYAFLTNMILFTCITYIINDLEVTIYFT